MTKISVCGGVSLNLETDGNHLSSHLYADDTQLYATTEPDDVSSVEGNWEHVRPMWLNGVPLDVYN